MLLCNAQSRFSKIQNCSFSQNFEISPTLANGWRDKRGVKFSRQRQKRGLFLFSTSSHWLRSEAGSAFEAVTGRQKVSLRLCCHDSQCFIWLILRHSSSIPPFDVSRVKPYSLYRYRDFSFLVIFESFTVSIKSIAALTILNWQKHLRKNTRRPRIWYLVLL